jgi:hypothetical protein
VDDEETYASLRAAPAFFVTSKPLVTKKSGYKNGRLTFVEKKTYPNFANNS